MKSLRRSLNSDKSNSHKDSSSHSVTGPLPTPLSAPIMGGYGDSSLSRPSAKVAPPQKVIKATHSYQSTVPQILSYQKGDFYYVRDEYPGDNVHPEGWYGALNPLSNSRGRVPKAHFEEFKKGGRTGHNSNGSIDASRPQSPNTFTPYNMSRQPSQAPSLRSNDSSTPSGTFGHLRKQSAGAQSASGQTGGGYSTGPPSIMSGSTGSSTTEKMGQPLYAIVQYDFVAERPDELNASAGEPIIVIAQSNHEWFVAKPIGRLGGPGLIPVSFVEIRDPVTSRPIENVTELLQQGSVPQVEAWKKAAENYKAASIPLGSFDYPQGQPGASNGSTEDDTYTHGPSETRKSRDEGHKPDGQLRDGEIISTHVKSFHYEAEAYWFRINAIFLPDDPDAQAISLVLYRLYEDFYNFQITLLDLFPKEAGRGGARDSYQSGTAPGERILPYMPGPLEQVDVDITNTRREDLDTYLRELLALRDMNAEYILRHDHVLSFFSPGPGDMTETISRRQADSMAAEVAASQAAETQAYAQGSELDRGSKDRMGSGVNDRMRDLGLGDDRDDSSAGRHSPVSPGEQAFFGNGNARTSVNGVSGAAAQGAGPHYRDSRLSSAAESASVPRGGSPASSNGPGSIGSPPVQSRGLPSPFSPAMTTGSTSSSFGSSGAGGGRTSGNMNAQGASVPLPHPQTSSSPANGTSSNQANVPAFIKIKILDRNTDDMIAIRVPPRVTYEQLVDKVRDRLVAQVSRLQYRNHAAGPGSDAFSDVKDDQSLRDWLDREDKLVLYAE